LWAGSYSLLVGGLCERYVRFRLSVADRVHGLGSSDGESTMIIRFIEWTIEEMTFVEFLVFWSAVMTAVAFLVIWVSTL